MYSNKISTRLVAIIVIISTIGSSCKNMNESPYMQDRNPSQLIVEIFNGDSSFEDDYYTYDDPDVIALFNDFIDSVNASDELIHLKGDNIPSDMVYDAQFICGSNTINIANFNTWPAENLYDPGIYMEIHLATGSNIVVLVPIDSIINGKFIELLDCLDLNYSQINIYERS